MSDEKSVGGVLQYKLEFSSNTVILNFSLLKVRDSTKQKKQLILYFLQLNLDMPRDYMILRDLSKVNKKKDEKPPTREERLAKARKSTGGPAPRKQLVCRNYRINYERRYEKKYSKKSRQKIEQLYPSSSDSDSEVEIPPSLENTPEKEKKKEAAGPSKEKHETGNLRKGFLTTRQLSCSEKGVEAEIADDDKENNIEYVFEPSVD